jgi:hypothetical protein
MNANSNQSSVGLVFVKSDDPVSRLTIAITKQDFSSIGFYYTTTTGGRKRTNVILMESFGLLAPKWSHDGYTMEDLLNNALVTRVAIKPLKAPGDRSDLSACSAKRLEANFRAAIAKVLSEGPEISIRESLQQLFGQRIDNPTKSVTNVELVNRVVMMVGQWDSVPQDVSISTDAVESLGQTVHNIEPNTDGKMRVLQLMVFPLMPNEVSNPGVANKTLASYVVPNRLFGDLVDLPIPARNPILVEHVKRDAIAQSRPYLTKVICAFVDMLLTDQEFFAAVVGGIHRRQAIVNDDEDLNSNLLRDLAEAHSQIADLVYLALCCPLDLATTKRRLVNLYTDLQSTITLAEVRLDERFSFRVPDLQHCSTPCPILLNDCLPCGTSVCSIRPAAPTVPIAKNDPAYHEFYCWALSLSQRCEGSVSIDEVLSHVNQLKFGPPLYRHTPASAPESSCYVNHSFTNGERSDNSACHYNYNDHNDTVQDDTTQNDQNESICQYDYDQNQNDYRHNGDQDDTTQDDMIFGSRPLDDATESIYDEPQRSSQDDTTQTEAVYDNVTQDDTTQTEAVYNNTTQDDTTQTEAVYNNTTQDDTTQTEAVYSNTTETHTETVYDESQQSSRSSRSSGTSSVSSSSRSGRSSDSSSSSSSSEVIPSNKNDWLSQRSVTEYSTYSDHSFMNGERSDHSFMNGERSDAADNDNYTDHNGSIVDEKISIVVAGQHELFINKMDRGFDQYNIEELFEISRAVDYLDDSWQPFNEALAREIALRSDRSD